MEQKFSLSHSPQSRRTRYSSFRDRKMGLLAAVTLWCVDKEDQGHWRVLEDEVLLVACALLSLFKSHLLLCGFFINQQFWLARAGWGWVQSHLAKSPFDFAGLWIRSTTPIPVLTEVNGNFGVDSSSSNFRDKLVKFPTEISHPLQPGWYRNSCPARGSWSGESGPGCFKSHFMWSFILCIPLGICRKNLPLARWS